MVRVFDVATGQLLMGWKAHEGEVLGLALDRKETGVTSIGEDGRVLLWSFR